MNKFSQRQRFVSLLSMSALERVGCALVVLVLLWLLVAWALGGAA
jgi:hypothetical protein